MKKQTAVEFLIKEFSDILGPLDTKPMQDLLMMDAMKKAKEMEKQQIEKAHLHGLIHSFDDPNTASEEYYNQTYNL